MAIIRLSLLLFSIQLAVSVASPLDYFYKAAIPCFRSDNSERISDSDPASCASACLSMPACLSFEITTSGTCVLQDGASEEYDSSCDQSRSLFIRVCDSEPNAYKESFANSTCQVSDSMENLRMEPFHLRGVQSPTGTGCHYANGTMIPDEEFEVGLMTGNGDLKANCRDQCLDDSRCSAVFTDEIAPLTLRCKRYYGTMELIRTPSTGSNPTCFVKDAITDIVGGCANAASKDLDCSRVFQVNPADISTCACVKSIAKEDPAPECIATPSAGFNVYQLTCSKPVGLTDAPATSPPIDDEDDETNAPALEASAVSGLPAEALIGIVLGGCVVLGAGMNLYWNRKEKEGAKLPELKSTVKPMSTLQSLRSSILERRNKAIGIQYKKKWSLSDDASASFSSAVAARLSHSNSDKYLNAPRRKFSLSKFLMRSPRAPKGKKVDGFDIAAQLTRVSQPLDPQQLSIVSDQVAQSTVPVDTKQGDNESSRDSATVYQWTPSVVAILQPQVKAALRLDQPETSTQPPTTKEHRKHRHKQVTKEHHHKQATKERHHKQTTKERRKKGERGAMHRDKERRKVFESQCTCIPGGRRCNMCLQSYSFDL